MLSDTGRNPAARGSLGGRTQLWNQTPLRPVSCAHAPRTPLTAAPGLGKNIPIRGLPALTRQGHRRTDTQVWGPQPFDTPQLPAELSSPHFLPGFATDIILGKSRASLISEHSVLLSEGSTEADKKESA